MDFESVFEKLARFDNRHRLEMIIFMIATAYMLALGLLNIRLETDPQSYKEQMYFNDNFGAFFRTQQIMMTQTDEGEQNLLDTQHKNYLYSLYFIESLINRKSSTSQEVGNRNKRLENTLRETGSSVFIGIGLTKFVGVVVLAFAKSTLFRLYYFCMYLGIVLMGVFHGLVLLPIVLYWITPSSKYIPDAKFDYQREQDSESVQYQKVQWQ